MKKKDIKLKPFAHHIEMVKYHENMRDHYVQEMSAIETPKEHSHVEMHMKGKVTKPKHKKANTAGRPSIVGYKVEPPKTKKKVSKKNAHKDIKKTMRKKVEKSKMKKVMHEFGKGELHSGSKKGPKVRNTKQALAIAFSEARKAADRR